MISDYNNSLGSENKITIVKKKLTHFIIASAGGMIKNSDEHEIYFQGIYRTYFPKISRSTSLNIGINYFNYKHSEITGNYYYSAMRSYKSTLISLPVQIQENFLNKNIRPYAFAGFNLSYLVILH